MKIFHSPFSTRFKYSTVLYEQSLGRQQRREEGLTIIPIPSYKTAKFLLSSGICTAQEAHKSIISIQKKEASENLMSNKRKPKCLHPTVMPQRCPSDCRNPGRRERKKKKKKKPRNKVCTKLGIYFLLECIAAIKEYNKLASIWCNGRQ